MTERDFEIGTRKFKLGKLDAFKQFHIVRRMGPILSNLLPVIKSAQKGKKKDFESLSEAEKFDQIAQFAGPLMNGLAGLSDADADLVLFGLLSSVEMQQVQGNWAKVSTPSMLMIQDLELPVLLNIAGRAFMFNLSSFFAALPNQ